MTLNKKEIEILINLMYAFMSTPVDDEVWHHVFDTKEKYNKGHRDLAARALDAYSQISHEEFRKNMEWKNRVGEFL